MSDFPLEPPHNFSRRLAEPKHLLQFLWETAKSGRTAIHPCIPLSA
ncbi:Uncharacterised protein [Serratia liquefaciens]|nr:Uncharacterised protein [Serratia liquefaciens]SUI81687.1 Uncharacterised protein [Serratia liquefaciens]